MMSRSCRSIGTMRKCPTVNTVKKKSSCYPPEKPCDSCPSKEPCDKKFRELLDFAACNSVQIERNVERLYENDPVGVTKPLDNELLRLTREIILEMALDLADMLLVFNPCDFICPGDEVKRRIKGIILTLESLEALLTYLNVLKSSSNERELCLAEANFTAVLVLVDRVVRDTFNIELLYACPKDYCR